MRALVCEPLAREGFVNAFSTRTGGTSEMPLAALNLAGFRDDEPANIYENRRRFLRLFAGDWKLMTVVQVHGDDLALIKDAQDVQPDAVRADALLTNVPRILLGVKTADCVPVILGDARSGALAAVHAGWRGTLAEIVMRAVARMTSEYGTRADDLRAAIGPAALGCCYEVGAEVVTAFRHKFADAENFLRPSNRPAHALIDLHHANRQQLVAAGLSPARIHLAPLCTMCRTDLFFSHRRENGAQKNRVGRSLSVIGRES